MILTVTLNPSVDIRYQIPHFKENSTNRVPAVQIGKTAGGKGLNVSRVIHAFGEPLLATGLLGGSLGAFIVKQLSDQGIPYDFTNTEAESRNCIAILHDGKQTEILEAGPAILAKEKMTFLQHFQALLETTSVVTLSGSLPNGLPQSFYAQLIALAAEKEIPVLLDTSGPSLRESLSVKEKPYLIKPNQEELIELTHSDGENLEEALQNPIFNGIPVVLVSLGKDGALVKAEDHIFRVRIPRVEVQNPVGSGDATLAGFAVALNRQLSFIDQLRYAMTAGVLNAMQVETGAVDLEKVSLILEQVNVEK
ncbi:1-phosphofructokinase family hexose kinase [Listeria valentina]|uniref:1-phosphofructokinase family hexose kinase n=1 Tax=Listeria valentina TaxID=2705293 RepID=UPI001431AEAA|nr:hexose kinase [Listeria valentina]